jgi:nucleoid DNA-binding protein/DNA-directed RNA polymerase subunit RPC12/RpoP
MKKNTYQKSHLVRELGFNVGVSQKKARLLLDALRQIAYRESCNDGFTLPGLCRFDVIKRKARKVRNPQSGERILIAEHDTLRVRILKKARNYVTPVPENLITVLPAAPAPQILDDFSKAVSFCCKKCGQEIEAPLSAAGLLAECPACGASITVPSVSEPGTLHAPAAAIPAAAPAPEPLSVSTEPASLSAPAAAAPAEIENKQKGQTIRIDLAALGFDSAGAPIASKPQPKKRMLSFFCKNCRQEIEAPAEMAGTASECPSCGVSFEVPFFSEPGTLHGSDLEHKKADPQVMKDHKSRTIRIEVPDDEA